MAASIHWLRKSVKFTVIDRFWHCFGKNNTANNRFVLNTTNRLASNDSSTKTKSTPLKKPNTPVGKWDNAEKHPNAEQEPLEAFPNDVNPATGEKGGPRGPEPTRYGDWERKGRCIDF